MRNPHGYAVIFDPELRGGVQEHDTITCPHCGGVGMTKSSMSGKLEVLVFRRDGSHYLKECGFCRNCMEVPALRRQALRQPAPPHRCH